MFIYLSMSPTFGSKDIVIRKSEFVAKTQFLYFFFKFLKRNSAFLNKITISEDQKLFIIIFQIDMQNVG